jgi:hypothetical protein
MPLPNLSSVIGRFGSLARTAWSMPTTRHALMGAGAGAAYGFATDRPMVGSAMSWGMMAGMGSYGYRYGTSMGARAMWNYYGKEGLMSAASKSGSLFFHQALAQGSKSARHLASSFTKPIIKV